MHDGLHGCQRELRPGQTVEDYFYSGLRSDFWSPNGRGDHASISGHILRVASPSMGATMCKQFGTPGLMPFCNRDDLLPKGWNCHEILHGNPYNHYK